MPTTSYSGTLALRTGGSSREGGRGTLKGLWSSGHIEWAPVHDAQAATRQLSGTRGKGPRPGCYLDVPVVACACAGAVY